MFPVQDKEKPGIENIGGLNLAAVKPNTFQMTKLPLWRKISEICMICCAKPILTKDFYKVQKEEFSITRDIYM
jgi:hypothetical protein